jgi:hypothetical protein
VVRCMISQFGCWHSGAAGEWQPAPEAKSNMDPWIYASHAPVAVKATVAAAARWQTASGGGGRSGGDIGGGSVGIDDGRSSRKNPDFFSL